MDHIKTTFNNWDDKNWWKRVAIPYTTRKIHSLFPHSGINILKQDWDNLIILDACRGDIFEENNNIEGELSIVKSNSSNTPEFLKKNFLEKKHYDTVYVTANPQVNVHLDEDKFHKVISVWKDNWDEQLNTVVPQQMAKETLSAYFEYPNKKIISHFVQPHYPFIGDRGQNMLNDHSGMELSKRSALGEERRRDHESIWQQLYEGSVSKDNAWEAYKENLRLVLPYVQKLVDEFSEKTVVTSDHGNAFGERAWPVPIRVYGHPPNVHIPATVNVPWLSINKGNTRKEIISEAPKNLQNTTSNNVDKRLADLGYK